MASRRVSGSRCSSGLRHELLDLANHLRQERLFVQNEKAQVSTELKFDIDPNDKVDLISASRAQRKG